MAANAAGDREEARIEDILIVMWCQKQSLGKDESSMSWQFPVETLVSDRANDSNLSARWVWIFSWSECCRNKNKKQQKHAENHENPPGARPLRGARDVCWKGCVLGWEKIMTSFSSRSPLNTNFGNVLFFGYNSILTSKVKKVSGSFLDFRKPTSDVSSDAQPKTPFPPKMHRNGPNGGDVWSSPKSVGMRACAWKLKHSFWAIYNDLSRGHPKRWFSKGIPPNMTLNQVKDL